MATHRFRDRSEAGRRLADRLEELVGDRPLVVGLARGGVPVAFEVARALEGDLEVLEVRKLGAPRQPELALGAVAPGAVHYNQEIVETLGISGDELYRLVERERQDLLDRLETLRGEQPVVEISGREVIVVDDGVATGATMFAAIEAARKQDPARVVVAVPVGAPDTVARLRERADDVVCLQSPPDFRAVGGWYEDFSQTTDAEVLHLLEQARARRTESEQRAGEVTG